MRDQLHAQHFFRDLAGFVDRLGDLNAATFAAASGMDLSFNDDARRSRRHKVLSGAFGFLARGDHLAAWHSHTELRQDCFRLVLVDFHYRSRVLQSASALESETSIVSGDGYWRPESSGGILKARMMLITPYTIRR